MAYKPIPSGQNTRFDTDDATTKTQSSSSTSAPSKEATLSVRARKNLRNPIAGTVEGEESLPSNIAPLIYLDDSEVDQDTARPVKERNTFTRITTYLDDRAQARYVSAFLATLLKTGSPVSPARADYSAVSRLKKVTVTFSPIPHHRRSGTAS